MPENSVQNLESFDLESNKTKISTNSLENLNTECKKENNFLLNDLDLKIDNDEKDPEIDIFISEISQIATNLHDLLKDHPQWYDKFLIIHQSAPNVISWAKEYDYKGVRANGYWTLIKIAIKLAKLVIEKYCNEKNPVVDHNLELLLDYALIAVDVLKVLREDSVKNPNKDNSLNLITSDPKYFIELFGLLLKVDDKMVAAMYGRYCGFWLSDQSRYTSIMFVTALAVGSRGLNTDVMQCIYNPEYRGLVLAKLIKSADISFVKMMGSIMEWRVYKHILPSLLYWRHSLKISEIYVKQQREWFLSACNVKVIRFENINELTLNSAKIRCRLYQNTSAPLNNKLIIHMHGGGFIIGTPESHDVYVQNWCSKLPGCSILSVDYSVSPEVKFPVAVQQLLDVYLYVTSSNNELEDNLGFKPKEFILAGDSAGGNLSMSLLLVLNDINKQIKNLNKNFESNGQKLINFVQMPKAILNLYAPYNLTLNISPSMILASCDSMISAGVMLSCFEAYLPLIDFNDFDDKPSTNSFKNENLLAVHKDNEIDLSNEKLNNKVSNEWFVSLQSKNFYNQMMDLLQGFIGNLKSFISPKIKPKPWYLADSTVLEKKLEALKEITNNPYISPILYEDFDDLKNINLYLIGLHYDPFLDDNVTMAKKWKGKVSFDVLDGLQHGFLNFMPFVDEAKKANLVCIERLREAIYC